MRWITWKMLGLLGNRRSGKPRSRTASRRLALENLEGRLMRAARPLSTGTITGSAFVDTTGNRALDSGEAVVP